ncbi:MAG: hypothetical protein HY226_03455 [Candidatus Vogelbacteria bacterium]|nr:hypothetical protein [Candidatus Vogelbacteria bacterium]
MSKQGRCHAFRNCDSDRFVSDDSGSRTCARGAAGAGGDNYSPSAVVLMCAESMPDPHLIFGQLQGTIAVVRNMANILPLAGLQPDSIDTGSVEYPVINQGARLIIVLGHTNCQVMQKVVAKWNEIKGKVAPIPGPGNQIPPANLGAIYQVLYPAVTKANKDSEVDLLGASIRNNVANTVAGLEGDTFVFSKLVQSGELLIVGAVYDPETRKVELLDK